MTLYWQFDILGGELIIPFSGSPPSVSLDPHPSETWQWQFTPSEKAQRAIRWSNIAEGIGLCLVFNIVINQHHPESLLLRWHSLSGRISLQ